MALIRHGVLVLFRSAVPRAAHGMVDVGGLVGAAKNQLPEARKIQQYYHLIISQYYCNHIYIIIIIN